MISQNRNAVVAGHICLDIIPSLDRFSAGGWNANFRPGTLLEVGPAALMTGGPVSNTGLALHKLGISTHLMGKVGGDVFGAAVIQIMQTIGEHLAHEMIVDPKSSTSYSVIISPPGVDRTFLHSPGANNTFCAADVNYEQAAQSDLFHFGYPPIMQRMYEDSGTELALMFQQVKTLGVTTSLDMAFPDPASPGGQADWVKILQRVLPFVDIFLPSIEELLFMTRRDLYNRLHQEAVDGNILEKVTPELLSEISADLIRSGVKIVVLKLGDRGLYLRSAGAQVLRRLGKAAPSNLDAWADCELWAPCFKVKVAGTTGSGDATIAGFLSAFLRDFLPVEAVTAAAGVGACNVEAPDALSGILPWEDTLARIRQGWPQNEIALSAPGWRRDLETGLWIGPAAAIETEGR
jgi:sugar/nucleoside kinase (ribokinase family)